MTSVGEKLYPPTIGSSIPAFYAENGTAKIAVPFSVPIMLLSMVTLTKVPLRKIPFPLMREILLLIIEEFEEVKPNSIPCSP